MRTDSQSFALTSQHELAPERRVSSKLEELVRAVRAVVSEQADWGETARLVASEIDREARKGKPTPSDHAPVLIDLDAPGETIDAGWTGAEKRVAARLKR